MEFFEEPECDDEKDKRSDAYSSHLLKTRTILIAGQIDQDVAEKTISQLVVLDAQSNDPIRVIITSQGGHVDSGYAIHDMLRFVNSEVICIGAGWVASIAVPILMGAPLKKNRVALPNCRFLLHQPSGGAGGQLQDIRIEAQEMLKIRERLYHLIAKETGQTFEKVSKDSDRNYWMSAEEAAKYGIIDRVIGSAKEIGGK
ncbi:MAG: ATP-dependent Clp protease proteolytic subunit [Candidatus Hydrogenedentes bacterium]|nr:ATP-dependent Clp protease proteolytic subunit [Candidatus Hydrogenedentota bacterium]